MPGPTEWGGGAGNIPAAYILEKGARLKAIVSCSYVDPVYSQRLSL